MALQADRRLTYIFIRHVLSVVKFMADMTAVPSRTARRVREFALGAGPLTPPFWPAKTGKRFARSKPPMFCPSC